MRIDVVTIFPDYLAPLSLSLVGKAITSGIVELGVHDLRTWTRDRHRTVDDTPYGGGAGMVMKPEPWGEALDAVAPDGARLIVPTPSGRPFTQQLATELAAGQHLVFACGRYEGIDARVVQDARQRLRVDEVSLGDYVLNGGEVAALAVIEAVVRLLPGVVGNPASLAEESHSAEHDGLLEYPVYTKPPSWRGLPVPDELLTGHHAHIAAWRRKQAIALTRARRPELLTDDLIEITIRAARPPDAGEILTLQRSAFVAEAQVMNAPSIPPLTQTVDELRTSIATETVLCAVRGHRIVGAVMGRVEPDGAWYVGRLAVAPEHQGLGLGARLLAAIETQAPAGTTIFRLQTGARSFRNHDFYRRRGYEVVRNFVIGDVEVVGMERQGPGDLNQRA